MNILVIPSIRENNFNKFLHEWEECGDWDEVILIEDNEKKTFKINSSKWKIHHFSHKEIGKILGEKKWIISKKDSSCRNFGFIEARNLGAKWILSLDDDCYPQKNCKLGICERHLNVINSFNICKESAGIRTRGMPYKNLGSINNILCNMGLWMKNADLDGAQGLLVDKNDYFYPPTGSFLAHPKHRYPYCGMNIFFSEKVIPTMYFALMGKGYQYNRFDDIWVGWIFQKVFEHLRLSWSIGEPFIEHDRASDPFIKLIKEANGIQKNEFFWEYINNMNLKSNSVKDAMLEIGENMLQHNDLYTNTFGKAILVWCSI